MIRPQDKAKQGTKASRVEAGRASTDAKSAPPKRQPGRPQGSKNKDKAEVCLNAQLRLIKGAILALLSLIGGLLPIRYLLLDGQFGHHNALQMARQCNLHLISKLRYDSQLFLPDQGSDGRRKYGDRLNPRQMPPDYRVAAAIEDGIRTDLYQLTALNPSFGCPLNVVVILKTHLSTQQQIHVILFSSDLALTYDKLVDYYSLRFQIEPLFKDCKTGGYHLEDTKVNDTRFLALVLLIALAYSWATMHGQQMKHLGIDHYAGRIQEHNDKTPRQSDFSLGLYGQRWSDAME